MLNVCYGVRYLLECVCARMCVCRFRDLGSIVNRHSCVKSSKYYIYHKRHTYITSSKLDYLPVSFPYLQVGYQHAELRAPVTYMIYTHDVVTAEL